MMSIEESGPDYVTQLVQNKNAVATENSNLGTQTTADKLRNQI